MIVIVVSYVILLKLLFVSLPRLRPFACRQALMHLIQPVMFLGVARLKSGRRQWGRDLIRLRVEAAECNYENFEPFLPMDADVMAATIAKPIAATLFKKYCVVGQAAKLATAVMECTTTLDVATTALLEPGLSPTEVAAEIEKMREDVAAQFKTMDLIACAMMAMVALWRTCDKDKGETRVNVAKRAFNVLEEHEVSGDLLKLLKQAAQVRACWYDSEVA